MSDDSGKAQGGNGSDDSAGGNGSGGGGNGAAASGGQAEAPFQIHAQYVKDLSFENPKAPVCFIDPKYRGPSVAVGADVGLRALGNRMAEVTVHVEARAQAGEGDSAETVYIVELIFAGLVQVGNVRDEQIGPLLNIEIPRLLFPYVRNIMSEATRDGGHGMMLVAPFDFAGLYKRKLAERARAAGTEEAPQDAVSAQIAGESLAATAPGVSSTGPGSGN